MVPDPPTSTSGGGLAVLEEACVNVAHVLPPSSEYTGRLAYLEDQYFNGPEERPRDSKIDEAKALLLGHLFTQRPQEVFYGRQIEVLFEKRFFHWITSKALRELVEGRQIRAHTLPLHEQDPSVTIRFYTALANRYWKRQADEIRKLVREYSRPEFGHALGDHAEVMFDAALPQAGFMPTARKRSRVPRKDMDADRPRS